MLSPMRTLAVLSLTVALLVLGTPAEAATKRVGNRQYVGFLQYANPFFIQGYVGLAPTANQRPNREAAVTLFVQRIRGTTATDLGATKPVVCNQANPEGEAAMGIRCGFSIPLASSSNATGAANAALRAGDRLRIKIAGVAGGGISERFDQSRTDTVLFDFPIGQAEKFLGAGQGNGQGEAPGNFYFQGRIQQIRADSIRGYAVDDLFLAGRPANNINIFNPTTVRVRIWQQTSGGSWVFWTEVTNLAADRTTETPLVQTSPGGANGVSADGTGGRWPFGFVANLDQAKRLDNVTARTRYYIRLEEARWRGGGTPIDARVVEFAGKDAVAVIRTYDWVRDGQAPEVQLQGDMTVATSRRIVETLETRALLEREEFLRKTPASREGESAQLRPAPERLYGYTGDTEHGERGALKPPTKLPAASGSNALTSQPVTGIGDQARAANQEINLRPGEVSNLGGFNRGRTNSVFVESQADNQNKRYIYEWLYTDPAFEKYVTVAFSTAASGGKSKRQKVEDIVESIKLPDANANGNANGSNANTSNANNANGNDSNRNTANANNSNASNSNASNSNNGNASNANNANGNGNGNSNAVGAIEAPGGFIKVYTRGGAPKSWDEVEADSELKAKRDAELPACQQKLDPEFNKYDLPFEVAALSPDQRRGVVDSLNAAAGSTATPQTGTNRFSSETKSKTVKVKLLGDWNHATWDTKSEVKATVHPLCVTARYMYERAYEKLDKEFKDRQANSNANGNGNGNANGNGNGNANGNGNSNTSNANGNGNGNGNSNTANTNNSNGSGGSSNTNAQRANLQRQLDQVFQRLTLQIAERTRERARLAQARAEANGFLAGAAARQRVVDSERALFQIDAAVLQLQQQRDDFMRQIEALR